MLSCKRRMWSLKADIFQNQKCGYVSINNVLYGQYNRRDNTLVVPLQPRKNDDQTKTDLEKVEVFPSNVKKMVHRACSLETSGSGTLPTLPLCPWFPVAYQVFNVDITMEIMGRIEGVDGTMPCTAHLVYLALAPAQQMRLEKTKQTIPGHFEHKPIPAVS